MWDEEINKKIKDAADQYHPGYDDSAWDNMEQMLNEHLPLKKDRRRIIYFLSLILLLGGVAFFMIFHKEIIPASKILEKTALKINREKPSYKHQNSAADKVVANSTTVNRNKNSIIHDKERNNLSKATSLSAAPPRTKRTAGLSSLGTGNVVTKNARLTSKNPLPDNQKNTPSTEINGKNDPGKNNRTDETISEAEKLSNEGAGSSVIEGDNNSVSKIDTTAMADHKRTAESKDVAKAENAKDPKSSKQKKTKKTFLQNFGIGLSIGPDISAVKLSKTGKITPVYGAGLSYSFGDKFTLRTGFYVAKKIYSVDENEYYVRPGSTWANYLKSIDANCKVYEVPLTLSYNFGQTKDHTWFVSAGLSSYFMKKESYVYYYKNPSGATYTRPWTVNNQNKHYFAVLDVSGGYEYSLNKRLSLIAEPYLKLPLRGIGAGKIKLNSAGVLFTVAVKPF